MDQVCTIGLDIVNRHSPFGFPSTRIRAANGVCKAIVGLGSCWTLRAGCEERPSGLAQPFAASFRPFSGAPVPLPAMRLAVLEWPPIIQTPLLQADRAGR